MAVRRITTLQGPTLKADDGTTAATIADSTGQITVGATNGWKLPVNKGTNDKYVLQIRTGTGSAEWAESLTAPEITSLSNNKINKYEAPITATGNTTDESNSVASISVTSSGDDADDLKVGQFISGTGIPSNTVIKTISGTTITLSVGSTSGANSNATATNTGTTLSIQRTPGEKNGGSMTLAGSNFGVTISECSVSLCTSAGVIIATASYLSALSGGNSITAEWIGNENDYATTFTSTQNLYVKLIKSGLSSNVLAEASILTGIFNFFGIFKIGQ